MIKLHRKSDVKKRAKTRIFRNCTFGKNLDPILRGKTGPFLHDDIYPRRCVADTLRPRRYVARIPRQRGFIYILYIRARPIVGARARSSSNIKACAPPLAVGARFSILEVPSDVISGALRSGWEVKGILSAARSEPKR